MPLARHDDCSRGGTYHNKVSTHMPLARHDKTQFFGNRRKIRVSTHMPLARHDDLYPLPSHIPLVSTHMPLARHDLHNFHGVP